MVLNDMRKEWLPLLEFEDVKPLEVMSRRSTSKGN